MTQITITHADICDQLTTATNIVELVTPDGRRLGKFQPEACGPVTVEEARCRAARPGGKSTAEVLEHLKRL